MKSLFNKDVCINPVRVTLIESEHILVDFIIAFFNGSYSYTFDLKYKSENIFLSGFISKSSLKFHTKEGCFSNAYQYIKEKLSHKFDEQSFVIERIKLFFERDRLEPNFLKPFNKMHYEIEFSELFA